MSRPLLVSAPGKVILHGEHAVVYGKAALATSLDLRCYLALQPAKDRRVTLHLPDFVQDLVLKKTWSIADLEAAIPSGKMGRNQEEQLQSLRALSGIEGDETPSILSMAQLVFLYLLLNIYDEKIQDLPGLSATVISNLPAGAGLGSSAAYSVCLAAGFLCSCGSISDSNNTISAAASPDMQEVESRLRASGVELTISSEESCWCKKDLQLINKWGFEAEKLIHGMPSGIDNSISTYGGAIKFKSGVISHLERMPSIRILLIDTKVLRSTKKMVEGVRERYNRFTAVVSPVLDSIDNITETAENLLEQLGKEQSCDQSSDQSQDKAEIHSQLEELFHLNQHLLNALGVGHSAIDKVCALSASLELSAKLTGGGGGGCVIALLPLGTLEANLSDFKAVFEDSGFDCWETNIACHGTSIHSLTT